MASDEELTPNARAKKKDDDKAARDAKETRESRSRSRERSRKKRSSSTSSMETPPRRRRRRVRSEEDDREYGKSTVQYVAKLDPPPRWKEATSYVNYKRQLIVKHLFFFAIFNGHSSTIH